MKRVFFLFTIICLVASVSYAQIPSSIAGVFADVFANANFRELAKDVPFGHLRQDIIWSKIEQEGGIYNWNVPKIRLFEQIIKRGKEIPQPIIRTGQFFRTTSSKHQQASSPPLDLEENFNSQYGYSRSYYAFVRAFVERYKDKLDVIVIENEMTAENFWSGRMDEYVRLFKTAKKAIKDVNPILRIAEGGLPSPVWGVCIAKEMLDKKTASPEEIFRFYKGYTKRFKMRGKSPMENIGDMTRELNSTLAREIFQNALYLLQELKGEIDIGNFHFYEPVEYFEDVVVWIRKKIGQDMPIMCNELGIRSRGFNSADTDEVLAQEIQKKIFKSKELGLYSFIWVASDWDNNIYGLHNADRSVRTTLTGAFMNTIRTINE